MASPSNPRFKIFFVLTLILICFGCANLQPPTTDQQVYLTLIHNHGLSNEIKQSTPFKHRVIKNPAIQKHKASRLHFYIEGDGYTWQQGTRVSADPTPRNPVMLKLLLSDPNPAIYLGRPCYFHTQDPACNPLYWTSARYHDSVVESLTKAIETEIKAFSETEPVNNIWIFGFSGGGTLAYLVAERIKTKITGVVTLGANLDIHQWAMERDAANLLKLSINPLDISANKDMVYLHYEGANDKIVSNKSTAAFKHKFPQQTWCRLPIDHSCCWQNHWPTIIGNLPKQICRQP